VACANRKSHPHRPNAYRERHPLAEYVTLGRFGRLQLAVYLEDALDLELPNEVIARFVTVGDASS
jgi:hypothetical protein